MNKRHRSQIICKLSSKPDYISWINRMSGATFMTGWFAIFLEKFIIKTSRKYDRCTISRY